MELKDKWKEALDVFNHLFKTDLAFREGILTAIGLDPEEVAKVSKDFMSKSSDLSLDGVAEEMQRSISIVEKFISSCNASMDELASYSGVLCSSTKTFAELMDGEVDNEAEVGLLTIANKFLKYDADLRFREELRGQSLEEVMKLLESKISTLTRAAGEQLEEMRNGYVPLVDSSMIDVLGREFGVLYSIIQGKGGKEVEHIVHDSVEGKNDTEDQKSNGEVSKEESDRSPRTEGRTDFIVDVNSMTVIKPPETPVLPETPVSKGRE